MNSKSRLPNQMAMQLKKIPAATRLALLNWPRMSRQRITFATSLLFGALSCNMAMADLPKICSSASCNGVSWYNPANTSIVNSDGFTNTGTLDSNNRQVWQLDQLSQNAVLNWATFNVDPNVHLYFHNQPYGANSSTLNRIYQGTPSEIAGQITADGRLYLLNQNGIIFRNGSQVDTHGLIASTLNIDDQTYFNGLLSAFNSNAPGAAFTAVMQNGVNVSKDVVVENGATLTAQDHGTVALFGSNVTQGGTIKTADGQVILAAGSKIYIAGSTDPGLRGWVVEVDSDVSDSQLTAFKNGQIASLDSSTVTNTGLVEALRGNISMVGLAINQNGISHATTAVGENGSIILKARDNVSLNYSSSTGTTFSGNVRDGRTTFGERSITQVDNDIEMAALTATDAQQPLASIVAVTARQIQLQANSVVQAVGGQVELRALDSQTSNVNLNPINTSISPPTFVDKLLGQANTGQNDTFAADARIQLESGSKIDVSGDAVLLPMSRNQLTVRLTSNELNAEPNQIDGILRGQSVNVDIRDVNANGRLPVADISAAVNNIARTVDEHTTTGGNVTLNSQGSLVFAKGASIDVSGGSIAYQDGAVSTTQLTSNGKVYDIGSADPNLVYDSIVGKVIRNYARWGVTQTWNIGGGNSGDRTTYYQGYVDGRDAGTVNIAAPNLILNGDFIGHTLNGTNQRSPEQQAIGGKLVIGLPGGIGVEGQKTYRAPNINVGDTDLGDFNLGQVDLFTQLPNELQQQAYFSTRAFEQGGFNRLAIYSNGVISNQQMVLTPAIPDQPQISLGQGAALHLTGGGEVNLNAEQIRLYGDITTPGGKITANTIRVGVATNPVISGAAPSNVSLDPAVTGRYQLVVGDHVTLSTAGTWVNDRQGVASSTPAEGLFINGGTITLNATNADSLYLGNHAVMDVQGGAWQNVNNQLTSGKGGTINIATASPDSNNNPIPSVILGGNLQLQGFALGKGGSLNLAMAGFDIGSNPDVWSQRQVVNANYNSNTWAALQLSSQLFSNNGFSSINLKSTRGDIRIEDGTIIHAQQQNRVLDNNFANQATGTPISSFSHIDTLDPSVRTPVNLTLDINNPNAADTSRASILMGAGSVIQADPHASISLLNNSGGQINIQGSIVMPGGDITMTLGHNNLQSFDPNLQIILGQQARLSTAGIFVSQPNTKGQLQGDIFNGGSVSLTSGGYIDAQTGSVLDVSGASAVMDLPSITGGLNRTTVASDAGAIRFSVNQGMALNGQLLAHAGSPTQRGGTLAVQLNQEAGGGSAAGPNNTDTNSIAIYHSYDPALHNELNLSRTLDVVQDAGQQKLSSGLVRVDINQIQHSGIDQLNLTVGKSTSIYATPTDINLATPDIHLDGNLDINFRGGVTLNTTRVTTTDNAVTTISAPYVNLGNWSAATPSPEVASTTGATLTINADLIDVAGNSAWQGFEQMTLHSRGDIRFMFATDTSPQNQNAGELATNAPLNLIANQIYPTTLTQFTVRSTFQPATAQTDSIYIGNNGGSASTVPLSVGGQLSLNGANITIDGTVLAPLGELDLGSTTTQRLTVTSHGSVGTSLDGEQSLFGLLSNNQWYYQLGGISESPGSGDARAVLPQQQISIKGDAIDLQAGSTLDVKGGGDLLAWSYTPIGKLYDPLNYANAGGHYFAILPTQSGQYAPYDPQEFAGWSIRPGDSVYLSGGGGVAAGTYAILPARFALLPGALLVQQIPGQIDRPLGTSGNLADGTPVVSGYFTTLNTNYTQSRNSSFALHPSSYAYRMAEYTLSSATDYLRANAAVQRTPLDAGTLTLTPQSTLTLNGDLDATPASGGRGVEVNIDSRNLSVVTQRGPDIAGQVQLVDIELDSLNAESILLGGTRTHGQTNTFEIMTSILSIADGVSLHGPEWILAAQQQLSIGDQVSINASSSTSTAQAGEWHTDTNSALMRASAGDQITLVRDIQGVGGIPQVSIGTGSQLAADRSILVDVAASSSLINLTDKVQFNSTTTPVSRNLTLSADQIHLNTVTTNLTGITVSTASLNAQTINNLVLQGHRRIVVTADTSQPMDVHGQRTTELYADSMRLDTANLQGNAIQGDTLAFRAGELSLVNTGENSTGSLQSGAATLKLQADKTMVIGQASLTDSTSALRLDGFTQVNMSVAKGDVTGAGNTILQSSGDITLTGSRVTELSGSDFTLDATGKRVSILDNHIAATSSADQLGAQLTIKAQSIDVAGNIELHSGVVDMQADGVTNTNAIAVTGTIDVSGTDRTFGDHVAGMPGGTIRLTAVNGNVAINPAAQINVSGASVGGDAGLLRISSINGDAQVSGNLQGQANSGSNGGRFQLDSMTVSGSFSEVNNTLNTGGFHGERTYHVRGPGNIIVAATDSVQADQINLTADQGGIQLAGQLNAAGNNGGIIRLNARDDVAVLTTAELDAHATVAGGNGGELNVNSGSGGIYLDGTVNVRRGAMDPSTGQQGKQGEVKLRLQQTAIASLTDSNVTNDKLRINANKFNADYLQIEAVTTPYIATNITATEIANAESIAIGFMNANAAAISTALSPVSSLPSLETSLRAGIEIQSPGDLNLLTAWDLSNVAAGNQPINVTLRAQGDLGINANLTDGFTSRGNLVSRRAADLTLIAGANSSSADITAVKSGIGNVTVNNASVHTGAGDITMAAGGNIELSSQNATIYTAGRSGGSALDAWSNYATPNPNPVKALPIDGGNLRLTAGQDIVGPSGTSQLFTDWLMTQQNIAERTRGTIVNVHAEGAGWYVNFSNFQQNFAAFGGGNLTAQAGRDITRASFATPGTGYFDAALQQEVTLGKGALSVHADGNINSGVFLVGDGMGQITTDQALTDNGRVSGSTSFGNVFAVMGGELTATARGSVDSSMVVNPTLISTVSINPNFFTYSANSAVNLVSLGENINFTTPVTAEVSPYFHATTTRPLDTLNAGYLPPTVSFIAGSGNITMAGQETDLYPSANGNFIAMANGNIIIPQTLAVYDVPFGDTRRISTVVNGLRSQQELLPVLGTLSLSDSLHLHDPNPLLLLTNNGDIAINNVYSGKSVDVESGRDLLIGGNVYVTHPHVQQDDVSIFTAMRDVNMLDSSIFGLNIDGPGQLYIAAGRNVDLGQSGGIQTRGNLSNPELPGNGANITVAAGLAGNQPRYTDFLQQYPQYLSSDYGQRNMFISVVEQIAGTTHLSMANAMQYYVAKFTASQQAEVRRITNLGGKDIFTLDAVEQFQLQVTQYMQDILPGQPDLSRDAALLRFASLALQQQQPLIQQMFYSELRTAGRSAKLADASTADQNYAGGYAALSVLFPGLEHGTNPYHGDVNLFFSQIKTLDGGDISILVPGGIVNAGLAVQPPGVDAKAANELGIVAAREGNVRIYTQSNIQVNQSRIFTLGGGDLLLWSSYGDIDAGRGSKTAISAPPPTVTVDSQGNVSLDFSGAIAGSGIRVICVIDCAADGQFITTTKSQGPGIKISSADVDLIAPHGTVSAGEAGIGSAGNLFIAAQQVVGANNIDVGGFAVGIPLTTSVSVTPPTVSSPETSNASTGSITKTEYRAIGDSTTMMYLDVDVIGFGDQTDDEKRKKKQ